MYLAGTQFRKTGTTLGTVAYMSPEQLRGEVVDHRTDIWSLGVMIYEMVTGQLPFKGDYEQAVTYSILNEEPEPMTGLRTGVPMELEHIVTKAMAKEPAERYQHMDEMPVDLKAVKSRPKSRATVATTTVATGTPPTIRWRRAIPYVLALLFAIVAAFAFWNPWREDVPSSQKVKRFTIDLSASEPLWLTEVFQQPSVTLSPDGQRFLMIKGEQTAPTQIKVVLNWVEELKRLVH